MIYKSLRSGQGVWPLEKNELLCVFDSESWKLPYFLRNKIWNLQDVCSYNVHTVYNRNFWHFVNLLVCRKKTNWKLWFVFLAQKDNLIKTCFVLENSKALKSEALKINVFKKFKYPRLSLTLLNSFKSRFWSTTE